jgi:hypothetical protein
MSTVPIPGPALARLRARYATFQETAQTIVEALGYGEVQGVNVNLDQGVLEVSGDGDLAPVEEGRVNGVPAHGG